MTIPNGSLWSNLGFKRLCYCFVYSGENLAGNRVFRLFKGIFHQLQFEIFKTNFLLPVLAKLFSCANGKILRHFSPIILFAVSLHELSECSQVESGVSFKFLCCFLDFILTDKFRVWLLKIFVAIKKCAD